MESQDLFLSGKKRSQCTETPTLSTARASTPSYSPTRSVKSQLKHRLSSSCEPNMDYAQVNGSVASNVTTKSLPCDLRRFSSPDTLEDDVALWRQFGIEYQNSVRYKNTMDDNKRKDIVEMNKVLVAPWLRCIIKLIFLVILSANLGVFFYAQFTRDSVVGESSSSVNAHSSDVALCSTWEEDELVHRLQSSLTHLTNELNAVKNQISQESKSNELTHPSRSIIEELLTDEPDLAAAGNWGTVLATPDTRTYSYPILSSSFFNMLSVSQETPHRPPDTTIQGLIQDVGDCWAFAGERGRLVLALHQPSALVRVSLSHIPSSMSVTGAIDSAPSHFLVLAHRSKEDLDDGFLLGDFEYVREGPWRQVFTLDPQVVKEQLFSIVEFRFLTNSGNPSYTCVYRVHVHGRMYF